MQGDGELEQEITPSICKNLLLSIGFNDNDRKNKEEKFYSLLGSQQVKFSFTSLNQLTNLNQIEQRQKLCQVLVTRHDIDRGTVALTPFNIMSELDYH